MGKGLVCEVLSAVTSPKRSGSFDLSGQDVGHRP